MLKDLNYLGSNARLCRTKKRMSATTRRVCGKIRISTSKEEKIMFTLLIGKQDGMVQRAAGKPAAYFVFVVLIMAEVLTAKLEFMVVAFFKPDEGQ